MALQLAIKDHIREGQMFTNRAVVALICILFITIAIIARMAYLQIISHQHYTTLSQNNRVSIEPLTPTRGLIFDRNGVILAQNLPTFSLEIVPERTPNLEHTLASLAEIIDISDSDLEQFHKNLQQKRRFQSIPLRLRLNEEEVARASVNRHNFPGVEVKARLMRDYPQGGLAVHALGYVSRINVDELNNIDQSNYAATTHIGKLGIEKSYETLLHGIVGYQQIETNALGRTIRVLERTAPSPGKNITLTLDAKLQQIAKDKLGESKGAVVAINPNNGDVLVLASKGDYDPNLFVNGISHKTYDALQSSNSKPLFNRALLGQYPPGSTFKPFIGLAGLELNETTPEQSIFCRGWYTLKGDERKYRDWKKEGHGITNLKKAITESCDVYFYDLARILGVDRIHDYLTQFGFGRRTDIDIAGEETGILPSTEWKRRTRNEPWYLGETLIAGIGQGYNLTTPLQLAVATATLANGGQSIQPHLLGTVNLEETDDIPFMADNPPTQIKIFDETNWSYTVESMRNVVHGLHGTARQLNKKLGYKIAGKTGTAQVFGIKQDEKYVKEDIAKHLQDHALFIAFAPAENPEIAVAVIVENGGSGGSVAAPIAGAIIEDYLKGGKQ